MLGPEGSDLSGELASGGAQLTGLVGGGGDLGRQGQLEEGGPCGVALQACLVRRPSFLSLPPAAFRRAAFLHDDARLCHRPNPAGPSGMKLLVCEPKCTFPL